MNLPEELPSPPEEITAEQERRNNIAAAMRKRDEADWNSIAADIELKELNPTPSEIRRAIDDLRTV